MTYLELVNKVLTRLREDTVTTVDYNDYSTLIGEFVNDAKKEVESAWLWSCLTEYATVTADGVSGDFQIDGTLTDSRLVY
jgi:hypothetical protein